MKHGKFHDRAVVASLKLDRATGTYGPIPQFHDRAVVASLKLGNSLHEANQMAEFHDRAVVASLKPGLTGYPSTFPPNSTTARSWPH